MLTLKPKLCYAMSKVNKLPAIYAVTELASAFIDIFSNFSPVRVFVTSEALCRCKFEMKIFLLCSLGRLNMASYAGNGLMCATQRILALLMQRNGKQ